MSEDLCDICHGTKRLMVGMSHPPGKTIAVHYEYDPCPECQPGPHSFYARRRAQDLRDMLNRRAPTAPKENEG